MLLNCCCDARAWAKRISLLAGFEDSQQILDTPSFEEDSGIVRDEDDAREVEDGEFCKPQAFARGPLIKKAPVSAPTIYTGEKRPASGMDSPEPASKKKGRKGKV
jgi:26S proteasome regulatory subunit (ATPase 3-interacting protein)